MTKSTAELTPSLRVAPNGPDEAPQKITSFIIVNDFELGLGMQQSPEGSEPVVFMQVVGSAGGSNDQVKHAFALGPLMSLKIGANLCQAGLALTEVIGGIMSEQAKRLAEAATKLPTQEGHHGYL